MRTSELIGKAINAYSRPFYRLLARAAIRESPRASHTVLREGVAHAIQFKDYAHHPESSGSR
jgi:hypothetical protein